jgi:four helix bundle protein
VELAVACYSTTKVFPSSEVYGMTSQIRRSSTSIAANIAEGHGRENTGSFIQFLRVAQGSLKELETHLSGRVGLMLDAEVKCLLDPTDENREDATIHGQESATEVMISISLFPYSLFAISYSLIRGAT